MQLQYKLTYQDYSAGLALHARRGAPSYISRFLTFYMWLVIGLLMCGWTIITTAQRNWEKLDWVNLVCGLVLVGLSFYIRVCYRRHFNRTVSQDAETILNLDPDLIRCQSAHSRSETEWAAIKRSAEDKKSFLLYLTPGKFIVVPKRVCTPEQIEELRALLQIKVGLPENRL